MEGHKFKASTYIALILLLLSGGCMAFLLYYSSNSDKAKVNNYNNPNNTSTKEVRTTDKLPSDNGDKEEIKTKDFSASLENILHGYSLNNNYDIELFYSGAKFNFKCSNYQDKCISGSAMMNTGTAIIPIYTYDNNEDDNYNNHRDDLYIIINEKYMILTSNYSGNTKYIIKNAITGYIINDKLENKFYPNYKADTNELGYYGCNNNQVFGYTVSLDNPDTIKYQEKIEGARCY